VLEVERRRERSVVLKQGNIQIVREGSKVVVMGIRILSSLVAIEVTVP
jgi:hypothetical protein